MATTHDDNATSWRDLADQLTQEQIAELEYCEREQIPPGLADHARGQLNCARKMAEINLARQMFADMAPPQDAVGDIDEWIDWDDDVYHRMFTAWTSPSGTVSVVGWQFSDGRVERSILCDKTEEMTAEYAREVASALVEAADHLERLS